MGRMSSEACAGKGEVKRKTNDTDSSVTRGHTTPEDAG